MFDNLKQGFLGLFLFIGHWLSPGDNQAQIRIRDIDMCDSVWCVSCAVDIAWNDQLGALVDAGIPLRFKISGLTDTGQKVSFVRTLTYDVAAYRYMFTDTSLCDQGVFRSNPYPQILLALHDFRRWDMEFDTSAGSCTIKLELLSSTVSRLRRKVDMSQVWGQRRLSRTLELDKDARRRRKEKPES
jgi:hypothetical protein